MNVPKSKWLGTWGLTRKDGLGKDLISKAARGWVWLVWGEWGWMWKKFCIGYLYNNQLGNYNHLLGWKLIFLLYFLFNMFMMLFNVARFDSLSLLLPCSDIPRFIVESYWMFMVPDDSELFDCLWREEQPESSWDGFSFRGKRCSVTYETDELEMLY